ncbi:MAG: ABC-type branched-chain amino acid transport system, permease component [Frankiales bacterium]|jgi:branched-chain amino acid transport system permease protein|nr:ABC-type branched-chain amino acid transport system, permease component [Frankiales bacterium]
MTTTVLRETADTTGPLEPTGAARALSAVRAGAGGSGRGPTLVRYTVIAVAYLAFMNLVVGLSASNILNGIALGSLYGILAVALVLVYRTSRIINFAAAALGAVPAITALLMTTTWGVSYLLTLPIAIVGGLAVGALTDVVVMRRFASSPRLIVTVVTIGLAQTFAVVGFFLPVWFGERADQPPVVETPWAGLAFESARGEPVLSGNQVFAFLVVGLLTAGLAVFFARSRMGMAVRASAENAERAALLGIPVKRVGTVAWALAGLLSSLAIFAQAPLIGVPSDATLGFDALLYGLAAAVVAGLDRMGTALFAGTGIGILIFASVAKTGSNDVASALMLVVILVSLLVQKGTLSRAKDSGVSTWQSVKVFRPVPAELRDVPEVKAARYVLLGLAALVALLAPALVGEVRLSALTLLPIYGIVAVSLVILTGWAGQISLGQFGLVGIGAAVSGGIVADHNIDFFVACFIGIAAGAVAAVLIGLPAIRIQGLYLAVTTLAFGYAMENYVLNKGFFLGEALLPGGFTASIVRPMLYGRWDLEDNRTYYYVCLVALVLVMAAALAFRSNRSGRVVIAMRDNQRAAASYSINPVRIRLAAFAVSGGMAGLAGTLLTYSQHDVIPGSYDVLSSIFIFLAACVAGLTSVWAAVVGVVLFQATVIFGPELWNGLPESIAAAIPLVLTGPLLILNLYQAPGGLAGYAFEERDKFLRRIAAKRGIHVPSLVADRRVEDGDGHSSSLSAEPDASLELAAAHGHEVLEERPDALACPVCDEPLTLETFQTHEHLRARTREGTLR